MNEPDDDGPDFPEDTEAEERAVARAKLIVDGAAQVSDWFHDEGAARLDNRRRARVLIDWLDDQGVLLV